MEIKWVFCDNTWCEMVLKNTLIVDLIFSDYSYPKTATRMITYTVVKLVLTVLFRPDRHGRCRCPLPSL